MTDDLVETIREALVSLTERMAAATLSLPAPRNPNEVADLLRKEVFSTMADLSNYRFDGKRVQEREGATGDHGAAAQTDVRLQEERSG